MQFSAVALVLGNYPLLKETSLYAAMQSWVHAACFVSAVALFSFPPFPSPPSYISIDAQETSIIVKVVTPERDELSSRYCNKRKLQSAGEEHSFAQIEKSAPEEQSVTFEQNKKKLQAEKQTMQEPVVEKLASRPEQNGKWKESMSCQQSVPVSLEVRLKYPHMLTGNVLVRSARSVYLQSKTLDNRPAEPKLCGTKEKEWDFSQD